MAHGDLRRGSLAATLLSVALALALAAGGCGGSPAPVAASQKAADGGRPPAAAAYVAEEASWGKFHSKRHLLTVSLPEGKSWRIDDHRQPELVALHAPTSSRLSVLMTREEDLANQERCENRARRLGWVPKTPLTTVEESDHHGPDDYRSRLWVALDAGRRDGSVEGHVYLFGAYLRQCLLVHLTTAVPSAKDEEVLASRLAVATTRIVKGLALDASRTTDEAVPRDKAEIRR